MSAFEDAIQKIQSSSAYQREGNFEDAYAAWAKANPGRARTLAFYVSTLGNAPRVGTLLGDGVVELVDHIADLAFKHGVDTPPPPEPSPPASSIWQYAEAIGAPGDFDDLRWRELHAANFRRFCGTILSGDVDDLTVQTNLSEFVATRNAMKQLPGSLVGGFCVFNGPNVVAQARKAAERFAYLQLDYLLCDVEDYKADNGGRAVAHRFETLVTTLASSVPAAKTSFITYGDTGGFTPLCTNWSDGKPIVEFAAAKEKGWEGFFEAYGNTGQSLAPETAAWLATQCFPKERSHISIGRMDVPDRIRRVLALVKDGRVAPGFSVWDAQNLDDVSIAACKQAIAAGVART